MMLDHYEMSSSQYEFRYKKFRASLKSSDFRAKTDKKQKKRPEIVKISGLFGGDKRDRTADLLNAIVPEVVDTVKMMQKSRQNSIKWTVYSPYRFNWYMVFCPASGTYSGT